MVRSTVPDAVVTVPFVARYTNVCRPGVNGPAPLGMVAVQTIRVVSPVMGRTVVAGAEYDTVGVVPALGGCESFTLILTGLTVRFEELRSWFGPITEL